MITRQHRPCLWLPTVGRSYSETIPQTRTHPLIGDSSKLLSYFPINIPINHRDRRILIDLASFLRLRLPHCFAFNPHLTLRILYMHLPWSSSLCHSPAATFVLQTSLSLQHLGGLSSLAYFLACRRCALSRPDGRDDVTEPRSRRAR